MSNIITEASRNIDSSHLVNGDNIQFEYSGRGNESASNENEVHSTSRKKKKKKKSKSKTKSCEVPNVIGKEINFDDPDFDYPDSRILKQDSNGDVVVQSLEPQKKVKKSSVASSSSNNNVNGILPEDPEVLNEELKLYWKSLSSQERKDLLNLERDSVFKVMREQQKITCNCSVCGRKRQIIEHELKKLYDTYFEGIDTHELISSELFNSKPSQLTNSTRNLLAQHQTEQSQEQGISSNEEEFSVQGQRRQEYLDREQEEYQQPLRQINGEQQQQSQPQPLPSEYQSKSGQKASLQGVSKSEAARRNGIMSVAEDLLQNDGRKFLEMMEKLAESRIQRQSQYLRRPDLLLNRDQIDEEENQDYLCSFDEDDNEIDSNAQDDDVYDDYDDDVYTGVTILNANFEDESQDEDPDFVLEETDSEDIESDEYLEPVDLNGEVVGFLESKSSSIEVSSLNEAGRQNLIRLQLERQKHLQLQLQREREELEQLQNEFLENYEYLAEEANLEDEFEDEENEDDLEDYESDIEHHHEHSHSCGYDHDTDHHGHSHSHSHGSANETSDHYNHDDDEDDLDLEEEDDDEEGEDDEDEFSDDAIDEEQQLEEGRAMLQLCTTKMLRQSLLESFKKKKQEEYVNALLSELEEEKLREKQREEKKQREKEKKREKKRLAQQQKEEERLKKEAEKEELLRKKEEENRKKSEEGRKRKQELERKKIEEKRRKEEEQERVRREKEEKRKLKEELKKKEEEEFRKKREEQRLLEQSKRQEEGLQKRELRLREELQVQKQKELEVHHSNSFQSEQNSKLHASHNQLQPTTFQPLHPEQSKPEPLGSLSDQFGTHALVNPLLNSVQQKSPFLSSPLSNNPSLHQVQSTQIPHPPGFAFDKNLEPSAQLTQNSQPQSQTSFYTPRISDPFSSSPSPWSVNQTVGSTVFNPTPFDNAFDRQSSFPLNSQGLTANGDRKENTIPDIPAQSLTDDINLLTSSLAATKFDEFGAPNILTGSKVWSSNPLPATVPSWSNSQNSNNVWGSAATPSVQQHQSVPQSSGLPKAFGLSSEQQSAPSTGNSNPSTSNVEFLIKNYQAQVFTAYSFSQSTYLQGGFVTVEGLFASFNSLQPPNQSVNFQLFLSILQSESDIFYVESIKDETGNIKFVKLLQRNNYSNDTLGQRNGSFPLNTFDSGSHGFQERYQSFDGISNSLNWGSSF